MSDGTTNLELLKERVREFCEARDWDQFHNPKDLAIGVVTEAAELLEIFRFKSEGESEELMKDPETREKAAMEMADVLFMLLRLAQKYGFDLTQSLLKKLAINEERYPVEKARGRNVKYDKL